MIDRDDDVEQTELLFRQQPDGRKVSRLPGGKVVLISLDDVNRVQDSERWIVRLEHRANFAIARPIEKVEAPANAAPPAAPRITARAYAPRLADPVPETPPRPAEAVVRTTPGAYLRSTERVALFVDGPNTDGAARSAGFFLDFGRVRSYFLSGGVPVAAHYFAADGTAQDPAQVRFFDYLSHAGFIVRRKPIKTIEDETGETRFKCDLTVEVAIEMLNTSDHWDVAFLLSGDGAYERAIDVLRQRGKRVYVVSTRAYLGRELSFLADKPVFYLDDHRANLEREVRAPEAAPATEAEADEIEEEAQ